MSKHFITDLECESGAFPPDDNLKGAGTTNFSTAHCDVLEQCRKEAIWKIASHTIQPQILKIVPHVRTLNDLQKLLGTINWLRPLLGITTQELHPLFKLLKGDPDLTSKRQLTPEAQQCLDSVITSVQTRYSHRVCLSLPVHLIIISNFYQPYSLLCQWDTSRKDPLIILEWVFLPHTFSKTITSRVEMFAMLIQRGRHRLQILRALDPES